MLQWAQAKEGDLFLELGSGTGRLSLMAAMSMGLICVGIDCISPFVGNANSIARRLGLSCTFLEDDYFQRSWSNADILYITATAATDEQVLLMSNKCRELVAGARLISLSYPPQSEVMIQLGMKMMDFSWGPTAVFLSERSAEP